MNTLTFLYFPKQNKNPQGLVGLRNLGNTVSASYYTTRQINLLNLAFFLSRYICFFYMFLFDFQCFMNSILQCLSNTSELRDYCLRNVHRSDLNNNCTTNAALMEGRRKTAYRQQKGKLCTRASVESLYGSAVILIYELYTQV